MKVNMCLCVFVAFMFSLSLVLIVAAIKLRSNFMRRVCIAPFIRLKAINGTIGHLIDANILKSIDFV